MSGGFVRFPLKDTSDDGCYTIYGYWRHDIALIAPIGLTVSSKITSTTDIVTSIALPCKANDPVNHHPCS